MRALTAERGGLNEGRSMRDGRTPAGSIYRTMSYYDLIVKSYDELYGDEQAAKYASAIRTRPRGRVLDVGCGIGLLYGYLIERMNVRPEIYVGIDVSFESLRELRRRYLHSGVVEAIAADAEHPPFRDGSGFTHLYAFTLFACDYGDVRPILSVIDVDVLEEAVITLICKDGRVECPDGFMYAGHLGRLEVACVRGAAGGI